MPVDPYDPLLSTLLDLLAVLEETGADMPLRLGGGYGLSMKQIKSGTAARVRF